MGGTELKGRLGDRLVERGQLTPERLEIALVEQRRHHRPLGEILVSLGFVQADALAALLAEDYGLEFLRAGDVDPDPLLLSAVDATLVREAGAFPYRLEDGLLRAVVLDPGNPRTVALLREHFPFPLQLALTTEADLQRLARTHLTRRVSRVADLLASTDARAATAADFPVERVTEAILLDGLYRGATDVHVEPEEHVTRVRYRVDGVLQSAENLPAGVSPAVVSRLKILAGLDIAERRRPQDGRLRLTLDEREVDMRVSILPTQYGENVVLRVLSGGGATLQLARLGVEPRVHQVLRHVAGRPSGLFLVTGPTGSGKTTTLYGMLSEVDAIHRKVATLEDPIEYRLPLLRQSQVDPAVDFDFATGLRALLRQDPDVILVGEIRDRETADMAIKASLTGHLVFSTLHTNSAIGAIPRLIDMGVEPYLVGDSLVGVLGQRLVRTVCRDCARPAVATPAEERWLGAPATGLRRGAGCEVCDGSGYQGRHPVMEVFLPTDATAAALRGALDLQYLERLALESGMVTMEQDGRRLVLAGRTTVEEVQRVTRSHFVSAEDR